MLRRRIQFGVFTALHDPGLMLTNDTAFDGTVHVPGRAEHVLVSTVATYSGPGRELRAGFINPCPPEVAP